jgi:hypothetical protein
MIPDRNQIEWYNVERSTNLALLIDAIRIGKQWAYVAHQTQPSPPLGWLEVYVNGVRVHSGSNQIVATRTMEDYLTGKRRIPGT